MTPYEIQMKERAKGLSKRAVTLYKEGHISYSVYRDILDDLSFAFDVDTEAWLDSVEWQLQKVETKAVCAKEK